MMRRLVPPCAGAPGSGDVVTDGCKGFNLKFVRPFGLPSRGIWALVSAVGFGGGFGLWERAGSIVSKRLDGLVGFL